MIRERSVQEQKSPESSSSSRPKVRTVSSMRNRVPLSRRSTVGTEAFTSPVAAYERHVHWSAAVAAAAARSYVGPDQPEILDRWEREHHELSTAIGHCLGTTDLCWTGLRIATDLWLFWPPAVISPKDGGCWTGARRDP